jgi:hypothetical protein
MHLEEFAMSSDEAESTEPQVPGRRLNIISIADLESVVFPVEYRQATKDS